MGNGVRGEVYAEIKPGGWFGVSALRSDTGPLTGRPSALTVTSCGAATLLFVRPPATRSAVTLVTAGDVQLLVTRHVCEPRLRFPMAR